MTRPSHGIYYSCREETPGKTANQDGDARPTLTVSNLLIVSEHGDHRRLWEAPGLTYYTTALTILLRHTTTLLPSRTRGLLGVTIVD
jgi:hypothetical protein